MVLPGLQSELICLQKLQEILQDRLNREREYTSSLDTWHTYALQTGPPPPHALRVVFLSLVEATETDIQSRRKMEATVQAQIQQVVAAIEGLRGHFERISARSEKLEEFDELARKALEERKLRYEEWKTWKPKSVPPWVLAKPKNSPAPTEGTMVAAYDLADMQVRRYISNAEVARCSFKDKAIAEVEAISFAYRGAIDAATKSLSLFAESQQDCASNASAGASKIVKVVDDISSFRVASVFQEALESKAQDISTNSIPYDNLESISRHPIVQSQPIILGFSLPPYYFSCTASTKLLVNVFRQLVSFVHDHEAWDKYTTRSTSTDYTLAQTFRELERSWIRDQGLNRDLLPSLGPSTCAHLVKTLLASFPEPLIDCSEVPAGDLNLWSSNTGHRPGNNWTEPGNQDDTVAPIPLVLPLCNRPQGEMLRALYDSLIPVFKEKSQATQDRISEIFSNLLTRRGGCIKHAFPILRVFDSPPRTSPAALPVPSLSSAGAMDATPTPSTPVALALSRPPFGPPVAPQSITQTTSAAVQVPRTPDEVASSTPINGTARPGAPTFDAPSTINDVESLKHGIVKMSKNQANVPYNILLVGETGVGKSSVFEFIANVLSGKDIDHYGLGFLDPTNERSDFGDQSRTESPRLYEITNNHGTLVRILDTPGLAGTRIEQDEDHKKNIVTAIEKGFGSVSAVLILADGIVPHITVDTDYTFSTLSAILPKTLANNIAFVFTNVRNPLSWKFSQATDLGVLKDAPQFLLDNPIALQNRFTDDPNMRRVVKACEQRALEMLVKLFDWLDGVKPQPATEIVCLHEMYENIKTKTTNTLARIDQTVAMKAGIDRLMVTLRKNSADMDAFSNFEKTVNSPVWEQQPTTTHKIDKPVLVDHDMKQKWEAAKDGKEKITALIAVYELVLHDLNQVINRATDDLADLVEQYGRSSLSGSFLEQLGSTARLLEQRSTEGGPGQYNRQQNLDLVKRRLEFLHRLKKNMRTESAGTGSAVTM